MQINKDQNVQELRQWMKDSGCLVHPAIQIPAYFNGIQGIGTRQDLPHKTVIIAIPSKLVITVPNCYNDPQLKSLYSSCDQLFDYEADQDAEFNILCVFLMYQKINIERSPWKTYLKTIAEPQTATSWLDKQLVGLNKSMIQQIVHVRKQCKKMQQKLCSYLSKRKEFKNLSKNQLINLFNIYYPTVLTRCFGYYFSTACIIPIADLMNHSCQSLDHQLIHINYELGKQYNQTYNIKSNKLNCQLIGLQKPQKQSMPFRLDFLLKNKLIQNNLNILGNIKRQQIDIKIYQFLNQRFKNDHSCDIQSLDFCQENDDDDNDTDQEQQNQRNKSMDHIKIVQKQQMELYQQHRVEVQKLGDVEKRIQLQSQKQKEKQLKTDNKQLQKQQLNNQKQTVENSQQTITQQQNKCHEEKDELSTQNQCKNSHKSAIQLAQQKYIPIQHAQDSPQESQGSEEQEWCLDESCYFTISTHNPVSAGSQLFNSYGSRTNKFLLVWYGFTYRNNLYDSVTLRLQVNFQPNKPKAKDIVLDTYLGGQGLCFKKNDTQEVKPQQVSRQFKLKRNSLPLQLLIFLRLILINYYKGKDNYKIICTLPSSLQFEYQLLNYLKQIIQTLYDRFPIKILQKLKQLSQQQQNQYNKNKIIFKIIYIQQQINILNSNIQSVNCALNIIQKLQLSPQFNRNIYDHLNITQIRKIKQYLLQLQNNFNYIKYFQVQNPSQQALTTQNKRVDSQND